MVLEGGARVVGDLAMQPAELVVEVRDGGSAWIDRLDEKPGFVVLVEPAPEIAARVLDTIT